MELTGTDDVVLAGHALVHRGRLFKLRLKRNMAAREAAKATIRKVPGGKWQARIGGRVRGKTEEFGTQVLAERAVDDHYNSAMMAWVTEGRAR